MDNPHVEGKYRLRIEHDDSPESPREMDPLGTMVCFHKRYYFGDKHTIDPGNFPGWAAIEQHLEEEHEAAFILTLYLMDHSTQSISVEPFGDRWDSGRVGFIHCSQAKADKWFGEPASKERILAALRAEVRVFDQWMQGDVWEYVIEEIKTCPTCGNTEYEHVDSLCGIYGRKAAWEEGKAALASFAKESDQPVA